jgi:hypothetical protein
MKVAVLPESTKIAECVKLNLHVTIGKKKLHGSREELTVSISHTTFCDNKFNRKHEQPSTSTLAKFWGYYKQL